VTPKDKICARSQVMIALEAGRMIKQPCAVCGTTSAEAHHDDYSKPLEVIWLCKAHHGATHAGKRKKSNLAKNYRFAVLVTRTEKREYTRLAQERKKRSLGELIRELLDAELRSQNAAGETVMKESA
jgi:hypothetical protein